MRPEQSIEERLGLLRESGLYRDPDQAAVEARGTEDGAPIVDARSNDYLGLAGRRFARETDDEGKEDVSRETTLGVRVGAGAARLLSGTTQEHLALESSLAEWLEMEACLVFSSAYAANVGTLSALAVEGDVVFSDRLNHASIIDGCRLSRAEIVVVPHRDLGALAAAVAAWRGAGSRWVVTEGYFGMDGTTPDLPGLRSLCDRHGAGLVVDEAHSVGVFGKEGRGIAAAAGVRADIVVGGLGKAFGLQGGFVASSSAVRCWLWNRARSFVFSTGVSPWLCVRALAHLRELRAAEPGRARLSALCSRLEAVLVSAGVPLPEGRHGPIFPLVFGSERSALEAAAELRSLGVVGQAIRPPTVPKGTARLRITLRADMTDEQVATLARVLCRIWGARTPAPLQALPIAFGGVSGGVTGGVAPRTPAEAVPRDPPPVTSRWVIFGTGTGVGKTFVAEALVRGLAAQGRPVAGLKPIETGCQVGRDGQPSSGDAARLEAASFHVKLPRPHPCYALSEPVAPSLAARREGVTIRAETVRSWLEQVTSPSPATPTLVIETAGGVFSPLTDTLTNLDLALSLGAARWVLVAPDRLGVLHDVASTLRALQGAGRAPDYLLLSAPAEPDASTGTNAAELRRLGVGFPVLAIPRGDAVAVAQLLAPSPLAFPPSP